MGIRQVKRKSRELRLLERRLRKQGQPAAVVASQTQLDEIAAQYFESGWRAGQLDGFEKSLEIAKEVKSVTTLRRRLGDRVRRAKTKTEAA